MNSLLVKAGVPQIRCVATGGAAGSLSYEVMIGGRWSACNYQFAAWWVGYAAAHSRKVIPLCRRCHDALHANTSAWEEENGSQAVLALKTIDSALAMGVIATGKAK